MSTIIDQRVVEMQFDNRHFEKNVSTTMSTLDKLKQKLHLPGAAKGLEDVSAAAKKVDLNPLGQAVETVRVKFSALQIMGVTALTNIANQAVNAGKRMVSALTIDPVKTGFNEYETKINSIQTIMSNTASKGTTMEDVTRVIDELNAYADKTIYNFSEMTRNIGTFTAAGVGLEESAKAIQGIANLAAASGSNSQQASTAMYQLSQALSAGTVKLMDWNSVVNAGMGGELFQNALKDTARKHGIAVDSMIKKHGSFRESLTEGWITAEVLTETLSKMTRSGAAEYLSKLTGIEQDQITATQKAADSAKDKNEAYKDLAKQLAATGKITEEEATNILTMADNAENAATKVKTFTQLWDTLKESAQSGWGKTWELVFGNFEQAQDLFTSLSDFLGGFVNKMNDARNFLVEGSMDITKPWRVISDKFNKSPFGKIAEKAEKVGKSVNKVTEDLEYFQDVVSRVWRGEYGNSDTGRFEKLDAEGYNHDVIQDLVNKGSEYKLTMEDVEASYAKFGVTANKTARDTRDASDKLKGSAEATKTAADAMRDLSDEELRNIGLTEDEIRLYRDLAEEADKAGISVQALIDEMSKKDGRTLLIESFKNAGQGLVAIFKALKDAWVEIFPPMSAVRLYGIIKSINEFSQHLRVSDETADKLKRTLKGVFAIIDIIATVAGGAFKIAFKAVTSLLGMFNLNILDVTAYVGDAVVRFRDWVDSVLDFTKIFENLLPFLTKGVKGIKSWIESLRKSENLPVDIAKGVLNGLKYVWDGIVSLFSFIGTKLWNLVEKTFAFFGIDLGPFTSYVKKLASGFRDWFSTLRESEEFTNFISWIKTSVSSFKDWIRTLKESDNIPRDIILGLIKGLGEGVSVIWNAAKKLVTYLIDTVKDLLGIHSPSTVFMAIGGFIIAGLVAGIAGGEGTLMERLKGVLDGCVGFFQNIDWGTVFAGVFSVGMLVILYKLTSALTALTSPLEGLGDLMNESAKVVEKFGGVLSAVKFTVMAYGIKQLAIALAILAGSLILMTLCDTGKLWSAVGVMVVMMAALAGLVWTIAKLTKELNSVGGEEGKVASVTGIMLSIAGMMLAMAIAVKIFESVSWSGGMAKAGAALVALTIVVGLITMIAKKHGSRGMTEVADFMKGLSVALILLAAAIAIIGLMSWESLGKAGAALGGLAIVVGGLMWATSKWGAGQLNQVQNFIKQLGVSMLLLSIAIRIMGGIEWGEFKMAAAGFGLVAALVFAMARIGKMNSSGLKDIGSVMWSIGIGLAAMSVAMRILGGMEWTELGVAAVGMTVLGGIVAGLVWVTSKVAKGPEGAKRLALTLLAMSLAIAILAGVAVLLGFCEVDHLAKGVVAVGLLAAIMSKMVTSLKGADDVWKSLIVMTAAVAVMALAVVGLSFIDWKKLIPAVAGLSLVMYMFGEMAAKISGFYAPIGSLIMLTVMLAAVGGVIFLVGQLDWKSSIGAAAGISILLGALVLVMKQAENLGSIKLKTAGSLVVLGVILAGLAAALSILAGMSAGNAIGSALALSMLIAVLVVVARNLNGLSSVSLRSVGTIAILTGVMAGLAAIILMLKGMNPLEAIGIVLSLSAMLVVMSGVCLVVSKINCAAAANGALGLAAFIGVMAVVIAALGGLAQIPGFNTLLKDGGESLGLIGYAIGNFVGSIIGGIGAGISAGLVVVGENLSKFIDAIEPFLTKVKMVNVDMLASVGLLTAIILAMDVAGLLSIVGALAGGSLVLMAAELSLFMWTLEPFLEGAAKIKPEMLAGVTALADTILILSAAGVLDGIASLLGGGSSLTKFAAQLPILGEGLKGFSDKLGGFSGDQLDTVTTAAQAVKTLAQASNEIPNTGGLLGMLVGENDLSMFAMQFPMLGTGLRSFLDNVGVFTKDELPTVEAAANAVKMLATAASEIPNSGGWVGVIIGENDLNTFAVQFPVLGTGLRGFLDNVGTFTDAELPTVEAAANAVKTLAAAASEIGNSGGWVGAILGENNLGTFATDFPKLGTGLRGLVDNVGALTPEDETTISTAANAVKILAQAAQYIPDSGGWIGAICGDSEGIGAFATDFPKVGEGIKGFADKLGEEWTNGKVATVNAGVNAVLAIAQLGDEDLDLPDGIEAFNKNAPSLGAGIKGFADSLSEIVFADIQSSIGKVNAVANMIRKMKDIESNWTQRLTDAIRNLPTKAIVEVVKEFKSDKTKTDLLGAIDTMVGYIVEGMTAKEETMKKSGAALADAGKSGISTEDKYEQWKAAGAYLTSGLAIGIKNADAVEKVKNAAVAVVKAAVKAAEDEAGIESPSRVFMGLGRYISEGFAIGIDNFAYLASDSSKSMASAAFNNTRDILSRLGDAISGDMDLQPTIRPVLDLSEVRARSKALDGMLNVRASSGVIANVRAIDARMEQRRQNGNNGEVVSAIKGLRKDLSKVGNTTYSINGITYSNGDEVAGAVSTIVRAARIERRR